MKTIYVATSGEYSTYGINGVFSSRQLAEEFCEKYNRGDCNFHKAKIEEYELDRESIAKSVECYGAQIHLATGEVTPIKRRLRFIDSRDILPEDAGFPCYSFAYSEESQEHAIKLAVERRQRWLRENPEQAKLAGLPESGTVRVDA